MVEIAGWMIAGAVLLVVLVVVVLAICAARANRHQEREEVARQVEWNRRELIRQAKKIDAMQWVAK